jgi:ERCC4-type nuclease
MATDIRKVLATLEGVVGVRLRYTPTPEDTVQEVVALHSWWTHKEWEEHRAHLVIQGPAIEHTWFRKPSILQCMVACLPGIGWKRSGEVAKHFTSPLEMVQAGINEWCEIEGIGKGIAEKVVNILQQKGR